MAVVLGDALATLHRAGYLHGDVEPSSIGFTYDGSLKLLDFGLARETADADARGGTLRYMSAEVLAGRSAEEADDVWSLCVVLHERCRDAIRSQTAAATPTCAALATARVSLRALERL